MTPNRSTCSTDQLVRDNQGNYYTVDADITFALADANLSGESGFTASTATPDAAAGVVQTFASGDIMEVADAALANEDVVITESAQSFVTRVATREFVAYVTANACGAATDTADHERFQWR